MSLDRKEAVVVYRPNSYGVKLAVFKNVATASARLNLRHKSVASRAANKKVFYSCYFKEEITLRLEPEENFDFKGKKMNDYRKTNTELSN